MTSVVMDPENVLISAQPQQGKYMSATLMYRGKYAVSEVKTSVAAVKAKQQVRFVDWSPTGFKIGINEKAPVRHSNSRCRHRRNSDRDSDLEPHIDSPPPRACAGLINNTAMHQVFSRILKQYDLLMTKHSFVHWYCGNGTEVRELYETEDYLRKMVEDYKNLETES